MLILLPFEKFSNICHVLLHIVELFCLVYIFMVSSVFFTEIQLLCTSNDESMYQCSNQVMLARMQSMLLQAEFSIFQLHANTIINAYVKGFCKIFYLML